MKLLVTGGAGCLGRHLARHMVAREMEIVSAPLPALARRVLG
ncbi:MAG TPA: hypothetical protein VE913_23620 [Longimicrobium sp.]|nr:hypothetical protein [Longimicrobium sp.]